MPPYTYGAIGYRKGNPVQGTQAQHNMANSLNFRRPLQSPTPEMIVLIRKTP